MKAVLILENTERFCYQFSQMETYAAIDIGSNTIRLLIARAGKKLEPLCQKRRITRLGGGIHQTGRISDEAMRISLECLREYRRDFHAYNIRSYRAVATAAARNGSNRQEFIDRARDEADLNIDVVSGEEESRLTLLGVLKAVKTGHRESLVF